MITVSQRRDIWTEEHQQQFQRAEALINKAIVDTQTDFVFVDVLPTTSDQIVVDKLCEDYEGRGWVVYAFPMCGAEPGLFLRMDRAPGAPRSGPGVG